MKVMRQNLLKVPHPCQILSYIIVRSILCRIWWTNCHFCRQHDDDIENEDVISIASLSSSSSSSSNDYSSSSTMSSSSLLDGSEVVRVSNRALDLQEYIYEIDGDDDSNDIAIEFMEDVEENVARVSTITRHVSESDETESVESASSVTDFELYIASEAYAEYGGLIATSTNTRHVSESDEIESVESTSSHR